MFADVEGIMAVLRLSQFDVLLADVGTEELLMLNL